MAEAFGVAASAVGIAATFTTCVDCFGYVQSARHLDRDARTESIKLKLLGLRLVRWGEGTFVDGEPQFGDKEPIVRDALWQMVLLFQASKNKSEAYENLHSQPPAGSTGAELAIEDKSNPKLALIGTKVKSLLNDAKKRQKKSGFVQGAIWALYDKDELKELNAGILDILEGLENAFPIQGAPESRVEKEVSVITAYDEEALRALRDLSVKVDSLISQEAEQKVSERPTFGKIRVVEGNAVNGVFVEDGYQGSRELPSDGRATFGEVEVNGQGAKVVNGEVFSTKSFF
ncbi:hypothetical protein AA0114_g12985 [Alternaria tenuissima]|uniref:Prion-inhibition and propagation HeLo domain-containing protein n=1 Tax=Alternaria tenuissima TaxID=119927 RepID=A0A4Q4LYM4_9PLEO|nr:hypothetical protein AA0114_g12985 [Alternaria tenuissima]